MIYLAQCTHKSVYPPNSLVVLFCFDSPEHSDLSQTMPKIVSRLEASLDKYLKRGVEQQICPKDPLSNPQKFFDGVWTPWRGSKTPMCNAGGSNAYCTAPTPPSPHPPGPSPGPSSSSGNVDGLAFTPPNCSLRGWCAGSKYSGPALEARARLNGQTLVNGTASLHREIAGDHGFELPVDCETFASGSHRLQIDCRSASTGKWFGLKGSPLCIEGGKKVKCE
jgi:hypothetical protein